ncbi:MAG: glycosyltransferase family 1 protein [Desulfobacterales bacterium]
MKVVFDFRKYDGVVGGVEQGVIQLTKYITSIDHSVVILCKRSRLEQVENVFKEHQNLKIIPLDVSTHAMSLKNVKLDSNTIQDIASSEKADIIHFFYNWSFPFRKKAPSILTVHDVIPFTFREAMGLFRNIFLYKPGIRKACRLNDIIATVSDYSKQDIAKKVGVPVEKIKVVPNGLRDVNPKDPSLEIELKNRFAINEKYVLNVGGIHERKNIVKLVHAFAGLVKHRGYSGKLLITGNVSGAPYQRKMKKICDASVRATGMENRIVFTGFVSEQELDSLFRMAGILIYPSLYEGFGMPILEAMKMGLPVITSNITAMPEVAGGAAYLVDPNSIEDMTSAMSEVLQNKILREEMIEKGLGLVHPYTWKNVSERYLELYQEIIESH